MAAPTCRCRPRRCRCAGRAAGASAGATWAPSRSELHGLRGAGPGRTVRARPSGRSGTASGGELHERTRLIAPCSPAARSGPSSPRASTPGESTGHPSAAGRWCGSRPPRRAPRTSRFAPSCGPARAPGPRRSARPARRSGYVWTRKRVVAVECDVRIGERRIRCRGARGRGRVVRLSPPPHGLGLVGGRRRTTDGRPVGWNLVSGINDPPERSERAIWVDGEPSEPGPATLRRPRGDRASTAPGSSSPPRPSAARRRASRWARYEYRQPFGTFTGTLPGGLELPRRSA